MAPSKLNQLQTILDGRISTQQNADLARMEPVHPHQHTQHQHSIKDEDVDFRRHQVSIVALKVFDDSEDASDQDQATRDVQRDEIRLPPDLGFLRLAGWGLGHAPVEHGADNDEAAEDEELHE